MPTPTTITHLRRGGTSVVVAADSERIPRVLHWGADLGELDQATLTALRESVQPTVGDSAVTYPQPVPVVPMLAEGWLGRPGVAGSRNGRAFAPLFRNIATSLFEDETATKLRSTAIDAESGLGLNVEIELTASGLLKLVAEVENQASSPYRLDALELALPVPDVATEILDLTGRWAFERVPQRHPFLAGTWVRESRGGKPGLDHSTVLAVGEPDFGFRRGRVWAVHLGWSGNHVVAAERVPAGTRALRAGEIFLPDEMALRSGETYRTPVLFGSWGEGLDQMAARFHRYVRTRRRHAARPRPVTVNTWEAVYFDHEPTALTELAERSAELGAERFVLDDGWFLGRRDDTTSLGDWIVDPRVWPDGLQPLATRVHELGMQFGLWVEPEMVSLDSELARAHPEWLFDGGHGPGLPSRHQHVLDLGHDDAYALVLQRISDLVTRLGIDFLKWDHNRYLTDAGHTPEGRPGARTQTMRAYRMMGELRDRHPDLEIESCASGGGRVDLGVLELVERIWPSDCNDPHDRIDIQRWTGLLVPPELQGTHVGAERAHTTGRVATLDFRAATALWGNLGIELDLSRLDSATFARLRTWVAVHKSLRSLLHRGDVVHADTDPSVRLEGVVGIGRRDAVYQFAVLDRPSGWPPARLRLPGLDQGVVYRVSELAPGERVPVGQRPPWMAGTLRLPGRVLEEVGIEPPSLDVDRSVLLRVTAID